MNLVQRGTVNGKPSWRLRWETKDPATGKRRFVYETFHGPRRAAERYWQRRWAKIEEQGASFVRPDRTPLREYLDNWLRSAKPDLRPTTAESYEYMSRHIKGALGAVPSADLTPAMIQKMLDDLRAGDDPLSTRTVSYVRTVLRIALQEAVRLGLIPTNPVDRTRGPRQEPRHVDAFTLDEATAIFERASHTRMRPVFEFAFYTGLRRGELCGLTWANVDMDSGRVVVRQARVKVGGSRRGQESKPKTEAGIRSVALEPEAVDLLRAHWAKQAREKMANRDRYTDQGFVFATELGNPLGPDDVSREFRRIRDSAGAPAGLTPKQRRAYLAEHPQAAVRKLPLHALRHTAVSVQIAAGVPVEVISKRIGHKSITTTVDTYGHLLPEVDAQAAEKVSDYLRQQGFGGKKQAGSAS